MLVLFRSNQVSTAITLAIFTILVRLPGQTGMIHPDAAAPDGAGMLYLYLWGWSVQQPMLSAIISTIFVYVQGLLINLLVNQTRVNPERNWLPPLLYVVVMSALPDFQFLSPALVAVTVMPVLLMLVFKIYKTYDPTLLVFDTGILTAVGALFYTPFILLFPVILLAINHLRTLKTREIGVFCSGVVVPGFLGWTIAMLIGVGGEFRNTHFSMLWQIWDFKINFNLQEFTHIGLLIIFTLIAIMCYSIYYHKRLIQVQKYNNILYWILITTCITALFRNSADISHFILAGCTLGIFLALSFQSIKNKAIAEILFLSLILAIAALFSFEAGAIG